MRGSLFLRALSALPLLAWGCSEPARFAPPRDAGPMDVPALDVPPTPMDTGPLCRAGVIYCAGNERYVCDETGVVTERVRCTAPAETCVQGRGCMVCEPNTPRCNPASPQQIQTCRADGSGYVDGPSCNTGDGETCSSGVCRGRCSDAALGASYLGCDYWPVTLANSGLDPVFYYAVVLSNPQTYAVRATITGGALDTPRVVELMPGAIETVTLPWVIDVVQLTPNCIRIGNQCLPEGPADSVLRRNGAYHIQSNGPIAAYQFNPLNFSRPGGFFSFTNDASLLLPQGVLTNHYIVSTWPNWVLTGATAGGFATIVAVSGESTQVTVRATAAVVAGNGVPAIARGGTGTFSLQPGDVVQLIGTGAGDLSGTVIESTNPVAVFVGHDCTNIPTTRPACDHLEQQLFPNETWGRDYFVSGLRDRPTVPAVVRIISQTAGNTLNFDPPSVRAPATLNAGQVLEFSTTEHFRVTGTGAFLVTQFMAGQGQGNGAGDPGMVFEVPVQQYRTSYDFLVPSTYQSNFINVVAPMGSTLMMDGQPFRGSMSVVSGYSIYTLPITAGAHRITAGNQQFGIKVYGVAPYTSYLYPGGLDLAIITPG